MDKQVKVAVLGSTGFLGHHVRQAFIDRGYTNVSLPLGTFDCNFEFQKSVANFYMKHRFDVVVNCLGFVGGIGLNARFPADMMYKNLMMNMNAIHMAEYIGVKKFVQVGTVCSYPKFADVPFKEEYLWQGFVPMERKGSLWFPVSGGGFSNYPEETNAPYGLAKRILLPYLQALRKQHKFNGIYLIPTNLYGPFDHFNFTTSHVIPAIILKVLEAQNERRSEIVCWGSGTVSRDFLYVKDAAEAIVLATERYDDFLPINIGSGRETRIDELVKLIVDEIGFKGEIVWDTSKPDGQPRRGLDITRAKNWIGFTPKTSLEKGIKETIHWYVDKGESEGSGNARTSFD